MFSNLAIAIYFGLGVGGYMYSKMQHITGGSTVNSLVIAGGIGGVGLIVVYTILGLVF